MFNNWTCLKKLVDTEEYKIYKIKDGSEVLIDNEGIMVIYRKRCKARVIQFKNFRQAKNVLNIMNR